MKIGVIVVTFNRLEKLKIALECYENQTYKPSFVLVYNNASTDGTDSFLTEWQNKSNTFKKIVYNSEQNIGGAGGFCNAMQMSLKEDFDFIWIADDDAFAENNCFMSLNNLHLSDEVGAVCSSVINNGDIDLSHRRIVKRGILDLKEISLPNSMYKNNEWFYINEFSFVGTAIRKEAIEKCGFPKSDYFIWYDDSEYSLRVNENYKIICVPSIKVNHNDSNGNGISWKMYYGIRNRLDLIYNHSSKFQFEKYYFRVKLQLIKDRFLSTKIIKVCNRKVYEKRKILLQIRKDALKDFKQNKFGISDKYKPGIKLI